MMGIFGRPHVATMLEEAGPALERIFGIGKFTIEKTSEYSALLTSELATFEFTDDPRDFVAASIVRVPGVEVTESPINTWTKFLGEETPLQSRAAPYAVQLAAELGSIARVVDQILVDARRARDAAWFVSGYNAAYNDWASRKGSWTKLDDHD